MIATTGPRPGPRPLPGPGRPWDLAAITGPGLRAGEPALVVQQRRLAGADDGVVDPANHELMVTHSQHRVGGADQVRGRPGEQGELPGARAPLGLRPEPFRS